MQKYHSQLELKCRSPNTMALTLQGCNKQNNSWKILSWLNQINWLQIQFSFNKCEEIIIFNIREQLPCMTRVCRAKNFTVWKLSIYRILFLRIVKGGTRKLRTWVRHHIKIVYIGKKWSQANIITCVTQ